MSLFFVCSSVRAGGYWFCDLLTSTGLCGEIDGTSIFRDYKWEAQTDFPHKKRFACPDDVLCDVIDKTRLALESKDGIFGAKLYIKDVPLILRYLTLNNIVISDVKWIFLTRTNKIKQAISFMKAKEMGWRRTKDNAYDATHEDDLDISFHGVDAWINHLVITQILWNHFFDVSSITPLTITYEELLDANHLQQIKNVLTHLEIDSTNLTAVESKYIKQASAFDERVYAQYLEYKTHSPTYIELPKKFLREYLLNNANDLPNTK